MPEDGARVLTTERLSLRRFAIADAPFVLRLFNEDQFLRFVGDKDIRSLDDARRYIREVPLADYTAHSYGAYLVRRADTGTDIGLCGLYRRANLDAPDLGFAFTEASCGHGFAVEAARGVIAHARDDLHLREIAALVDPGNDRSRYLLGKLGFLREGSFRLPGETKDLCLYRLGIEPAA